MEVRGLSGASRNTVGHVALACLPVSFAIGTGRDERGTPAVSSSARRSGQSSSESARSTFRLSAYSCGASSSNHAVTQTGS